MVWFLWKKLWNACVPGKVKIGAWRGCLDVLPTRTKLVKKSWIQQDDCLFCGGQPETIEHILRDCSMAATIWFSSLGLRVNNSYNLSLRDWISQLGQTSSKHTFEMVLVLLWNIWKTRNNVLWQGRSVARREVGVRAEGWLQAYQQCHLPTKHKQGVLKQRWTLPSSGWIKCNFDRTWDKRTSRWGIWGIVRNDVSASVAAFSAASANVTKLSFWTQGRRYCSSSNYTQRVKMWHLKGTRVWHLLQCKSRRKIAQHWGQLLMVRSLIHGFTKLKLKLVCREANNVAHRLARPEIGKQSKVSWFDEPPNILMDTLLEENST